MTTEELAVAVKSMRDVQKYHAATQNARSAAECRKYERIVDEMIETALHGRQRGLFTEGEGK